MVAPRDDLILKLELRFAFHRDASAPDRPARWFRDRALRAGIAEDLTRQPLVAAMRIGGDELDKAPIASAAEARRILADGGDEVRELQDVEAGPRALIRVEPSDGELVIKVWCGGEALARQRASLLDQLTAIASDVRARLRGRAGLAHGFAYPVYDDDGGFDYPRPRPPRVHDAIQIYAVLDLVDRTFHRSAHPDATPDGAERLAASALPGFATRREEDGLVVIRWADDAGDVAQLERGAAAHEAWIAEHLETRIDGPYDERGDRYERRGPAEPRPPLTLYGTRTRTGYKAVVVFPDGTIEDGAWKAAREIVAAGHLPDGAAVEQVKLVAPTRELALAIRERARAEGFAAVLYPKDDGGFWDPDPPGRWA